MVDETDLAVDTLYDIAKTGGDDYSGTSLSLAALPTDVRQQLANWATNYGAQISDIDDAVYKGSWFDGDHTYYGFTFNVSSPEVRVGTVILNEHGVIGVSATGSS